MKTEFEALCGTVALYIVRMLNDATSKLPIKLSIPSLTSTKIQLTLNKILILDMPKLNINVFV